MGTMLSKKPLKESEFLQEKCCLELHSQTQVYVVAYLVSHLQARKACKRNKKVTFNGRNVLVTCQFAILEILASLGVKTNTVPVLVILVKHDVPVCACCSDL